MHGATAIVDTDEVDDKVAHVLNCVRCPKNQDILSLFSGQLPHPSGRSGLDVTEMDGVEAEGMGDVAGLEERWFRSGAHICETVSGKESTEM